jgi:hypothetical protein
VAELDGKVAIVIASGLGKAIRRGDGVEPVWV